eukprot:gene4469-4716_t
MLFTLLLLRGPVTDALNTESVAFASANRARIIEAVNADSSSSWTAELPARFAGTPYSVLIQQGAGIIGGDPRENKANLSIVTLRELAPRAGLDPSAPVIPDAFRFCHLLPPRAVTPLLSTFGLSAAEYWPQCPMIKDIRDQSACGSCYATAVGAAGTDRFCVQNNGTKTARLSSTDLMSCCFTCKGRNGGCYGGWVTACWDYMVQQGIASGGDYGDHSKCLMYPFDKC